MNETNKPALQFTLNGRSYQWHQQYILGQELKDIGGIQSHESLFLVIAAPWENELILNSARVDLAREGIEHFISKDQHPDTIILTIETPKGKWENVAFNKDLTIAQVIERVVLKFGFDRDGNYKLKIKGASIALEPNITLEGAHLRNHEVLVFTDLGKGAGS